MLKDPTKFSSGLFVALRVLGFGLGLVSASAVAQVPIPQMIELPGGTFQMGSEAGDADEAPIRTVVVAPFAIGTFEVTVQEFRAFAQDTGLYQMMGCRYYDGATRLGDTNRKWDAPGFDQAEDFPVVCVSWDEAVAYTKWLSAESGDAFRLPTEAEWEYAARAGQTGENPWAREAGACGFMNASDQARVTAIKMGKFGQSRSDPPSAFAGFDCNDGWVFTAPVGSYAPNSFGLHDMLGNAWEMTTGCFKYAQLDDGSDSNFCLRRAPRGGSWLLGPGYLRYANRGSIQHDHRNFTIGFRVAKSLEP